MAKMDRGSAPLKAHLEGTSEMHIRQTRRGCFQELLGCEAKTEFKYFIGNDQVAQSLDDDDCLCRIFCSPCHPFTTVIKELNTDAELLTVDRPFACPIGGCKCCLYQEADFTSDGQKLGNIKETFYCCVPRFDIFDDEAKLLYKLHQPTCCGGMCVNCCAEGNPCTSKGCCKESFRVYDANQEETDGDAPYLGYIMKKPKSAMVEIFTDADAFDVKFPENATVAQKGILVGTAIFINATFFENQDEEGGGLAAAAGAF